jgi:hypothetical protein
LGVKNLIRGTKCPVCNRVSGHAITCEFFKFDETKGKTSRPKLFDAAAVLWGKSPKKNFLTFTLPSLSDKTYQRDYDCPGTGDLVLASKFSKVLEAYSLRCKRQGNRLSYVWVSEAQMERKEKYGGIGDLHYHLVINQEIKNDRGKLVDVVTLNYLQDLWNSHIGIAASNSLDIQPLPPGIISIPPYISKYMGKGSQRMILSRRFGATRDLTKFKAISLRNLPIDLDLISSQEFVAPNGYETSLHYFNTRQTLELYGGAMIDEGNFEVTRTSKDFTPDAIIKRAIRRQRVSLGLSYST